MGREERSDFQRGTRISVPLLLRRSAQPSLLRDVVREHYGFELLVLLLVLWLLLRVSALGVRLSVVGCRGADLCARMLVGHPAEQDRWHCHKDTGACTEHNGKERGLRA